MQERPKVEIELSPTDKLIDRLSFFLLIFLLLFSIYSYSLAPDIIPIHFNFKGEPDGYGRKETLLILPLIAIAIFFGMSYLNWYPHIFNYPVNITADNAHKHYSNATRMIRFLKLSIMVIFAVIEIHTYLAYNKIDFAGQWLLPVLLIIILFPTFYFLWKAFRKG